MSATHAPVNRAVASRAGEIAELGALAVCFLLGGFAALVYQIAWTRQFALVFGTSELAVAAVLAAYMAGLAAGAALVERWLPRITRPVLAYAGVELAIGASAVLVVPLLIAASGSLLRLAFGGQHAPPDSEQVSMSLFHLASAFVALAIPTALMGATLPLLARHVVRSDAQIGRRVGSLYAINTAGAVGGALATAFVLLPELGLADTVRVGGAVNLLAFVVAAIIARRATPAPHVELSPQPHAASSPSLRSRLPPSPVWVLPVMFGSGAVSFFHEVLWTRMLSHVLGSSVYAFGVMVASFLAGITIGGAAGAALARERRTAAMWLAAAQLACAGAAAGAWLALDRLVPETAGLAGNASFAAALLLPLTIAIGVTYPLAVRVLAEDAAHAARASARVYAWNTLGAIVGALLAGFVAIPAMRYEGAVEAAVVASSVLAIGALFLAVRPPRLLAAIASVAALAVIVAFRPVPPERLLVASPLNVGGHGRMLYYDVGPTASVVMLDQDGMLALRTNGLPEALMDKHASVPRFSGEYWLSPLAVLARPGTERMLIVGYGGGVSIEAAPPTVRHIDVIELEPKVVEANRAVASLRRRDPLADPRVEIVSNDARGALSLTSRRYDAIVSQPSHPFTAGASHLYTREFLDLARARLAEGGVLVQWMNVSFVDEALLRAFAATLLDVFSVVRLYRPDPNTLVFLASDAPLEPERIAAAHGSPLELASRHYTRFGIRSVEDLYVALAADEPGTRALAHGAAPVTDDHNRMATSSVHELGKGLTATATGRILAPYDPLQRTESWVYREPLAFDHMARRIATFASIDASAVERLQRMARALNGTASGAYARAVAYAAAGQGRVAARLIRESLPVYPDSEVLRYEFLRPWFPALARGVAPPEVGAEAAELQGAAAAALAAASRAVRDEWQDVSELEPLLARAPWTAPWKLETVQMRVEWRLRVADGTLRERYAAEALALTDEALILTPTVPLFALRARAALIAGRPDAFVEALYGYAQGAWASRHRLEPAQREEARDTINGLIELLDRETAGGRADPVRVGEVRARLEAVAREIVAPA